MFKKLLKMPLWKVFLLGRFAIFLLAMTMLVGFSGFMLSRAFKLVNVFKEDAREEAEEKQKNFAMCKRYKELAQKMKTTSLTQSEKTDFKLIQGKIDYKIINVDRCDEYSS